MSKQRTAYKKIMFPLLGAALLLVPGILLFLYFKFPAEKRADYQRIDSETYDSAFLSMYPIGEYAPEDFAMYRGMTLLKTEYQLPDFSALEDYLKRIANSGNTINTIYLGIIPEKISSEELLPLLQSYPSVIFEVLPAHPSLTYLAGLSEEELASHLTAYENLIAPMMDLENIHLYSFFAEEWFIANPANYQSEFEASADISRTVMLNADRDHPYLLTSKNVNAALASFSKLATDNRAAGKSQEALTDWYLVFFGDSIIANYTDSTSVPGVVSGLSGAQTFNYAVGGSSAAWIDDESVSFPQVVKRFLSNVPAAISENNASTSSRRLCFVINFGLNDYFVGYPIDDAADAYNTKTYAGALRLGIQLLQEAFPDADILVMAPNFASYYTNGTEKTTDAGGILTDYVTAAQTVAEDMNTHYMNNYTGLGITADNWADYLLDGCHLNEAGRFLLGTNIIEYINSWQ